MAGMDQKDLALCWLSRCVPLIVGGDSQVQFLDKVLVCFGAMVQTVLSVWRCRVCSSSSRTSTSSL